MCFLLPCACALVSGQLGVLLWLNDKNTLTTLLT